MVAWFRTWHLSSQLMLLLVLFNLIDYQTTATLVHMEGFEIEANPFLYHAMVHFDSVYAIVVIKALVLAVFWVCLYLVLRQKAHEDPSKNKTFVLPLITLNILFASVSVGNSYLISLL